MKIQLSRTDKVELLKAIQSGMLDTFRVPSLFQSLEGANAFLETMKKAFQDNDDPPSP